jgi:hypothetical protein
MGFMTFHSVGNVIIPTDELTPSFFRGVGGNHQAMSYFDALFNPYMVILQVKKGSRGWSW